MKYSIAFVVAAVVGLGILALPYPSEYNFPVDDVYLDTPAPIVNLPNFVA